MCKEKLAVNSCQLAFVAPGGISSPLSRGAWQAGLPYKMGSGSCGRWFSAGQGCVPQHMQTLAIVLEFNQKPRQG